MGLSRNVEVKKLACTFKDVRATREIYKWTNNQKTRKKVITVIKELQERKKEAVNSDLMMLVLT